MMTELKSCCQNLLNLTLFGKMKNEKRDKKRGNVDKMIFLQTDILSHTELVNE